MHLNHGSAWLSIRYFSARLPAGGLSLAIPAVPGYAFRPSTPRLPAGAASPASLTSQGAGFAALCRFSRLSPSPAYPISAGVSFPPRYAATMPATLETVGCIPV